MENVAIMYIFTYAHMYFIHIKYIFTYVLLAYSMFSSHYLLSHTFVKLLGAKREKILPEMILISFKFPL